MYRVAFSNKITNNQFGFNLKLFIQLLTSLFPFVEKLMQN